MSLRYLSLFDGIGAVHVAWAPLGWTCVARCEIEPFPDAVVDARLSGVPNLGDVAKVTDEQIAALGVIDLVVGGSPCQDLSVAGKREGLAGARSGLFHHQVRIFHAARSLCGARFLLWENVPGAFSTNKGRDFASVVALMAGLDDVPVPAKGWGTEGCAVGDHGLLEWCVLDAQWFGVAQRRRRVFALLDAGEWADRPPVLLEPESLRGNPAPSREAGQGAAAGTLRSTDGGLDCDHAAAAHLVPAPHDVISPALKARDSKGPSSDGDGDGAILVPMVAHSLRAEGFDASEDGTGRGTPLVPVAFDERNVTSPTNRSNPQPGDPCHTLHKPQDTLLAFSCKDHGADAGELAPTLRAMGHGDSHANAGGQVAVAFALRGREDGAQAEVHDDGQTAGSLRAASGGSSRDYVAFQTRGGNLSLGDVAGTLGTNADRASGGAPMAFDARQSDVIQCGDQSGPLDTCGFSVGVQQAMQVRRLTPRECERLQGFPDDYTLIPYRGKPAADGPRYKALGNSMAVPVMRWIGRRIEEALT